MEVIRLVLYFSGPAFNERNMMIRSYINAMSIESLFTARNLKYYLVAVNLPDDDVNALSLYPYCGKRLGIQDIWHDLLLVRLFLPVLHLREFVQHAEII